MRWLVAKMKWIMLASGALTLTMIQAAIAPESALRSTFGETVEGAAAEIVVRNWGVVIALVGAMLMYGAFHPPSRPLVLAVAGLSKLTFIGLVLAHGDKYLGYQAGTAVAVDSIMVALFLAYLFATRRPRHDSNRA